MTMKYIKISITAMMILSASGFFQSQVKPMDATLSTYQYPFEVKYKELNSQNQNLKMAYMDVQPKIPNGKTIVILHGKNFNCAYWE